MKVSSAPSELIEKLYTDKYLKIYYEDFLLSTESEPAINSYYIVKSHNNSAIVRYIGEDSFKLLPKNLSIDNIRPKDSDQNALLDALLDKNIQIVCVTGPAGSGKTFLSLAYALFEILENKNKKLLLTKATETVKNNKFFGAVPGTIDEKFAIFLDSYELAMNKILGSVYTEKLKQSGQFMYKPIEFCRGDSRDDTILIVDESQNLDWHSTKTILTRLGENSKAILLGDTSQKDIKQFEKSGFERLISSGIFKDSTLTTHIQLVNDYRGPISKLISQIAEEVESKHT